MTPPLGKIPSVMTCKCALLGRVFLGVLATTLVAQAAPSCEAWNTEEYFWTAVATDREPPSPSLRLSESP